MFNNKSDRHHEFWKWFAKNQEHFYQFETNQEKLSDLLNEKLKELNRSLAFEISVIKSDGKRELSISTDGEKKAHNEVIEFVNKAPVLENWQFKAFRQSVRGNNIQIRFGDIEISSLDIFFKYEKDGKKIGIELNIRNFVDSNPFKNATLILIDNFIGEYERLNYMSWFEFVKLNEEEMEDLYPLIELRDIIDSVSLTNRQ